MIVLILILIFLLVIAATWWFGLWSNFITLINLILCGMIATSLYQPLAAKLMSLQPTYRMLFEFVSLWLVFVVAFIVVRGATDFLSSIRLRFDFWTETIGRSVLSVAIASVFITFTMFSLQLAPLPPKLFGQGASADTATRDASNDLRYQSAFGPDRLWVSFVRFGSKGAFAQSREKGLFLPEDKREFTVNEQPLELESRVFDPTETFFINREFYRDAVAKSKTLRVR